MRGEPRSPTGDPSPTPLSPTVRTRRRLNPPVPPVGTVVAVRPHGRGPVVVRTYQPLHLECVSHRRPVRRHVPDPYLYVPSHLEDRQGEWRGDVHRVLQCLGVCVPTEPQGLDSHVPPRSLLVRSPRPTPSPVPWFQSGGRSRRDNPQSCGRPTVEDTVGRGMGVVYHGP